MRTIKEGDLEMKISRNMFNIIYAAAIDGSIKDKDAFVSEWTISVINNSQEFEKYSDADFADIPDYNSVITYVNAIWEMAHISIRDIIKNNNLAQKQFANYFMIPISTVESWCMGTRKIPEYEKILICESLGMLNGIVEK